jgi:hypothetical protein
MNTLLLTVLLFLLVNNYGCINSHLRETLNPNTFNAHENTSIFAANDNIQGKKSSTEFKPNALSKPSSSSSQHGGVKDTAISADPTTGKATITPAEHTTGKATTSGDSTTRKATITSGDSTTGKTTITPADHTTGKATITLEDRNNSKNTVTTKDKKQTELGLRK